MNVYLESSAALRDILDAHDGDAIRAFVAQAETVVTSQLTLFEVARVWARLAVLDPTAAALGAARYAQFQSEQELWFVQAVDDGVWTRCCRPFPQEPVRLLDAIHLATMEKLSAAGSPLTILSTDSRVRANAKALGFALWDE